MIDSEEGVQRLCEIFQDFTSIQLRYILDLCSSDLNKVIDFLQSSPSAVRLHDLLKLKSSGSDEIIIVRLQDDDTEDDWVQSAIALYKGTQLTKGMYIRVFVRGQPGIDTGKILLLLSCTSFVNISLAS